jgi:cytochrome c oxidase subunit II
VKIPSTITTLLFGIGLTLFSLWIGQHHGLLPTQASIESHRIDSIFNAMMAISAGLFVLVQGALVYALFRFRRKPGDETDAEPIEGNVPLEIVWTAIPTVIVLWLAIYSFDTYKAVASGGYIGGSHHMAHAHTGGEMAAKSGDAIAAAIPNNDLSGTTLAELPAATENQFEVKVNGLQYAWIFNYPKTGVVSGELHLPLNQNVQLSMSANDVIHAFWVPEFRLKQDVIPGETTYLNFTPNKIGNYPLICAELCGAYHGGMRTRVIVQTPEEFQQWQQSQIVAANPEQSPTVLAANPDPVAHRLHGYAKALDLPQSVTSPHPMHHQMLLSQTAMIIAPEIPNR